MLKGIGFEILLASPPSYHKLVAEIYYQGKFVLLVNQEKGPNLFEVETPGYNLVQSEVVRRVELSGLLTTIEIACQRLAGDFKEK